MEIMTPEKVKETIMETLMKRDDIGEAINSMFSLTVGYKRNVIGSVNVLNRNTEKNMAIRYFLVKKLYYLFKEKKLENIYEFLDWKACSIMPFTFWCNTFIETYISKIESNKHILNHFYKKIGCNSKKNDEKDTCVVCCDVSKNMITLDCSCKTKICISCYLHMSYQKDRRCPCCRSDNKNVIMGLHKFNNEINLYMNRNGKEKYDEVEVYCSICDRNHYMLYCELHEDEKSYILRNNIVSE